MPETNRGNVVAVSIKNKSVLIECDGEENWFNLGPAVKPNFIKKGAVDFKITGDGEEQFVSYIRNVESSANSNQQFNVETQKPENAFKQRSLIEQEAMQRMCAIKAAAAIFEGTGKAVEATLLAEEMVKFIETGKFREDKNDN